MDHKESGAIFRPFFPSPGAAERLRGLPQEKPDLRTGCSQDFCKSEQICAFTGCSLCYNQIGS
ncbi:MAG: hypothetical protein IKE30_03370 [Clostridia bacterium]|nr:hypothetical protein [Clostridia bacterium]